MYCCLPRYDVVFSTGTDLGAGGSGCLILHSQLLENSLVHSKHSISKVIYVCVCMYKISRLPMMRENFIKIGINKSVAYKDIYARALLWANSLDKSCMVSLSLDQALCVFQKISLTTL